MKFILEKRVMVTGQPARARKVKHWAGYGSVKIKYVCNGIDEDGHAFSEFRIQGDHERKLIPADWYTAIQWIVNRYTNIVTYRISYHDSLQYVHSDKECGGIQTLRFVYADSMHLFWMPKQQQLVVTPEKDWTPTVPHDPKYEVEEITERR